jgi:hypothetical protein
MYGTTSALFLQLIRSASTVIKSRSPVSTPKSVSLVSKRSSATAHDGETPASAGRAATRTAPILAVAADENREPRPPRRRDDRSRGKAIARLSGRLLGSSKRIDESGVHLPAAITLAIGETQQRAVKRRQRGDTYAPPMRRPRRSQSEARLARGRESSKQGRAGYGALPRNALNSGLSHWVSRDVLLARSRSRDGSPALGHEHKSSAGQRRDCCAPARAGAGTCLR